MSLFADFYSCQMHMEIFVWRDWESRLLRRLFEQIKGHQNRFHFHQTCKEEFCHLYMKNGYYLVKLKFLSDMGGLFSIENCTIDLKLFVSTEMFPKSTPFIIYIFLLEIILNSMKWVFNDTIWKNKISLNSINCKYFF